MKHRAFWENLSSKDAESILENEKIGSFLLHDLDEVAYPFYNHLVETLEEKPNVSIISSKKKPERYSHRFIIELHSQYFFYDDEVNFQAEYIQKYKNLDQLIASDGALQFPLKHS